MTHDLRPGTPDLSAFPRDEWVAALRRALRRTPDVDLGYGDARGLLGLRAQLAAYLGRTRGVLAGPDDVVVVGGWVQALALVVETVAARGATAIAMEDPCMAGYREATTAAGLAVVRLPVDAHGADPTVLDGPAGAGVGAVLLTPAHQFPSGAILAPERRAAFVAWARRTGGLLVEDDYDGELRYDRQPVGALQALAPGHVAYAGTASKCLAPGLRLGWLVAPPDRLDEVVAARRRADRQHGVMDQLALAELIAGGGLDRHIRRQRARYRRRRDALVAGIADLGLGAIGIAAGLHAVVPLPPAVTEADVHAHLADRGVAVGPSSRYLHDPSTSHERLVVGFGTPPEHAWPAALAALLDGLGTAMLAADPIG